MNTGKNRLIYDAFFGSEFSNPDWDRVQYETVIEYLTVQEFNQIRGKPFVEYSQFAEPFLDNKNKIDATL
jgi:hypothetical protein